MLNDDTNPVMIPILILGIIIVILLACCENKHYQDQYNNGICPVCGGKYEYQQAVGHRYTTHYIYKCNGCGDLIEVDIEP